MKFGKAESRDFSKKQQRICKECHKQLTREDVKKHRRVHELCEKVTTYPNWATYTSDFITASGSTTIQTR